MDYHTDMFLFCILVITGICRVSTQGIPADRTFEVCTGSPVVMTFKGAKLNPNNLMSWHFTPAGTNTEEDVALVANNVFRPVSRFVNRGLEMVGDQGLMIPNISKIDSGLFRFNQDTTFKYNVSVKDPCLNDSQAVLNGDKMCKDITCLTEETFKRLEIMSNPPETILAQPYTLCANSAVMVTCVVEGDGQEEFTDKAVYDLSTGKGPDDGGLGTGAIVGIVIGGVALIAVVVGGVVYWKRHQNSRG